MWRDKEELLPVGKMRILFFFPLFHGTKVFAMMFVCRQVYASVIWGLIILQFSLQVHYVWTGY